MTAGMLAMELDVVARPPTHGITWGANWVRIGANWDGEEQW